MIYFELEYKNVIYSINEHVSKQCLLRSEIVLKRNMGEVVSLKILPLLPI